MDARVREHVVRAAIYCRISDDRKGERLGVDRQEDECRELVERRGWEVADVYTDNDLTASKGLHRPEYERMLADVEAGLVGAVATWHNDRLHRSPLELERFIDLVDRTKIAVVTVTAGTYDLTTASGRMAARILGAVARAESERLSERIRSAQDQRAALGLPAGGPRTFGYCGGPEDRGHPGPVTGMELVESEAKAIRQAVAALRAGTLESWTAVAKDWNANGVKPPRAEKWSASSVTSLLTSANIAALRVHRGEVVGEAAWPAIITRADHEWLVARKTTGKPGRRAANLLTNIAVCGRCGLGMRTGWTGRPRRRIYKCNGNGGCHRRSITGDGLDRFVTEAVLDRLSGPSLVEFLSNLDDGERDYAALVQGVQDAEDALDRLSRERVLLGMEDREYLTQRDALRQRRDEARAALDRGTSAAVTFDLPRTEQELRATWEASDVDARRRIVGAVLDRIVVRPVRVNGPRMFDPGRLDVCWRF